MELFQAQDNFIILNGPDSLWCNRLDGRLQPRFGKASFWLSTGVWAKPFHDRLLLGIPNTKVMWVLFTTGVDLGEAWSLKCRGIVYGVIGKIQFFPGKSLIRIKLYSCTAHSICVWRKLVQLFKISLTLLLRHGWY